MKRTLLLAFSLLFLVLSAVAQTQQGYVKTLGKRGKKGVPLSGVIVRAKGGHNEVKSGADGTFSMPLPGKKEGQAFSLQQVQKSGYELNELNELDVIGRRYAFSTTVRLTIVMAPTAQLQADKRRIENNAYKAAEKNYKSRMSKLEKLLRAKSISEEQYRTELQDLQSKFERYQSLIESLAEHYAHTDYDELTDKEAEVNQLIEDGELERADSLIHTMFDMADALKRNQAALAGLEQTIADAQGVIDQANADLVAVLKQQEKNAEYLYQLYTIALAQFDNEKASQYIQTRAALDTTNVEWQNDAGRFAFEYQSNYHQAYSYFQRGLEESLKQYGQDNKWVASFKNNLGLYYLALKEYDKCMDSFSESIAIYDNLDDADEQFKPLVGIGLCYLHRNDNYNAIIYLIKALSSNAVSSHSNDRATAAIYEGIGLAYQQQGEYENALAMYQTALAFLEQTLGKEHHDVSSCLSCIGLSYQSMGEYNKSLEFNQKSLELAEKVFGTNHTVVANCLAAIGLNYQSMGEYDKAVEFYQKSLAIRETIYGNDFPDVASSYNDIGSVYKSKNDYGKSLEFFFKSLAIYEKLYGTDNVDVASCYENIASIYDSQGDPVRALEYYQKTRSVQERVLDKNDPSIAITYDNIGMLCLGQNDYDAALAHFKKALFIQEQALGVDNPVTALTYTNIGLAYSGQNDFTQSLEWFEKALPVFKGNDDMGLLNSYIFYVSFGNALFNLSNFAVALEQYTTALDISKRVTDTGIYSAVCYNNIGEVYFSIGDYDKALENFSYALSIREKELGDDHPDTQSLIARIKEVKERKR